MLETTIPRMPKRVLDATRRRDSVVPTARSRLAGDVGIRPVAQGCETLEVDADSSQRIDRVCAALAKTSQRRIGTQRNQLYRGSKKR